jgi:DNA-binding transcriptional MerR regulator
LDIISSVKSGDNLAEDYELAVTEKLLKVGEVEAEYGFTRKTLRYWDKLGIVPPRWVGTHRVYGEKELERLQTVKKLVQAGYTPKQLEGIFKASGVLPSRPLNEDVVYRELLQQASKGKVVSIDVGKDFQTYNTAYKRLRRLADEMGLRVLPHKEGESLQVRARRR